MKEIFDDHPINDLIKQYDEVRKISTTSRWSLHLLQDVY